MRVDVINYAELTNQVMKWAKERESRYVCVSNVHMAMEAHDSESFRQVVNRADLVTPDGMPLVWSLWLQGLRRATRVYGPNLTRHILAAAADEGMPVGFFGSSEEVLRALIKAAGRQYPGLRTAYAYAPPFRALAEREDAEIIRQINDSGAAILFVGLGCPKQECWMAAHRGQIRAPMLGVGAAFDFLAGAKPQAPVWMQAAGLEWLFRLMTEPRRLWVRYLKQNPRFIGLFVLQQFGKGFQRGAANV
jgi:N-acetylglucosaminyldiphosphoundecaprenol N-acetyl-beta-D-mannosaminyltransferase